MSKIDMAVAALSTNIDMFKNFRKKLEGVFSPDTAAPGTLTSQKASAGHCAAVAIVVNQLCGGEFKSVIIDGKSHWFNCIDGVDVDLTGDQFYLPSVNIGHNIYPSYRIREAQELNDETRDRAYLLSKRLGFALGRFNP